jgi:flagellar FliL protein
MAEEKTEKNEEGAEEVAPVPTASKKKLILALVGGLVLLLAIGIPVSFFVFKEKKSTEELPADAAQEAGLVPEGHDDEDALDEGEEGLGAIFPLETFVVNLQGGRFIRCQMQLEFQSREVPRRFYAKLVPIRDAIISLLTKRQADDVVSEKGKGALKGEIKEIVNEIMHREDVKTIYFTQFVVQ